MTPTSFPTTSLDYPASDPTSNNPRGFVPGFFHRGFAYCWSNVHLPSRQEATLWATSVLDLVGEDALNHAQVRF